MRLDSGNTQEKQRWRDTVHYYTLHVNERLSGNTYILRPLPAQMRQSDYHDSLYTNNHACVHEKMHMYMLASLVV